MKNPNLTELNAVEKCECCHQMVPTQYICKLVEDFGKLEKECTLLCHECFIRTGVVGWEEKKRSRHG